MQQLFLICWKIKSYGNLTQESKKKVKTTPASLEKLVVVGCPRADGLNRTIKIP